MCRTITSAFLHLRTLPIEIEGTSSVCREGSLWVNIPKAGEEFRRENFTEYKYVRQPLHLDL